MAYFRKAEGARISNMIFSAHHENIICTKTETKTKTKTKYRKYYTCRIFSSSKLIPSRTFKDLQGLQGLQGPSRTFNDLQTPLRTFKDLEGLSRTLMDLQ